MLVARVVVAWLVLVVCWDDTGLLVVCPALVVYVDTVVEGRVVCTVLVPCEGDTDDPALVVVCVEVVPGVNVTWLVLVTCDEDDPGVEVMWLELLLCVDEDDPGVEVMWLELLPCVDEDDPEALVVCPKVVLGVDVT